MGEASATQPSTSGAYRAASLLVALALCFAASAIGGLATSTSVGDWYQTLNRPGWTPPGWLFGPVWASLYAAMAVAVWLVWLAPGPRRRALVLFGAQLVANTLWSVLFFGLQRPGLAAIEIVLLLGLIVATALEFRRHSKWAAVIMIPYAAWVGFATALNVAIWWLNR